MTAIDLFCGVGGLTHGLVEEGIRVIAGMDLDIACKYAYEKNNHAKFIHKDIEEMTSAEIIDLYPDDHIRILIGCAPCRPFSKYGNKKVRKKENNEWRLLREFMRIIEGVQPEIVSMENVPLLVNHSVFAEFISFLDVNDYHVCHDIVFCPEYGIPQNRKRLVLFASKFGEMRILKGEYSERNHKTVRDAIQDLEPIEAGEVSKTDPLHRARDLSETNKLRIKSTPEGGGWRDWDYDLLAECHRKQSGKTYVSVYGRMSWDEPAPTITTQFNGYGNGKFGHPDQNRAISYREGSLLQTFPQSYDFIDPSRPFSGQSIARHIGNAVPVDLGRAIARSIKKHIQEMG
ncbi:DNA cytosine methyltransferase [Candidatus Poribacteria bacterium]